jgi:protease-4
MKNFLTVFFSSLLGVIISTLLIGLIFVFSVVGVIKNALGDQEKEVFVPKTKSVLLLDFSKAVSERKTDNPLDAFDMSSGEKLSLDMVLMNLRKAKTDTAIKGLYMKMGAGEAGFATLEEIRNGIMDFKKSGKFVVAYGEVFSQKSYYLASVAELKGLSAQVMFYKNALEKLNVEVQVFRHGKFKSAVEPFFLDKMSENNRAQTETFLNSIWSTIIAGICQQRGIAVEEINRMADEMMVRKPEDAVKFKLVDALKYDDEVQSYIKEKIGIKGETKVSFVKMLDYKRAGKELFNTDNKNKIAVIYAVGEIEGGEGDDETIGSDRIARTIREARMDSSIKAIVLRVNSPGGSALASDIMWREIVLAKKTKPFVVSMGDVAASGGYYISCAADRVFAQPNTITGSIGVFGIMPNAQKLLSEKMGINIDTVNTNKHSDMGTMFRALDTKEGEVMQAGVEDVYQTFIGRVAEGRGISKDNVDSIGQGRVWSGTDALKIKLVDEIGGLEKAILYAASKAKLKEGEFKMVSLPKKSNPIEKILKNMESDVDARVKEKLGKEFEYLNHIRKLLTIKGVQARLPYDLIFF